jgi:excinuclease ABC subunit B
MGRGARGVDSHVILYADNVTGSMGEAISEVNRRRAHQLQYNKEHGITPKTIEKEIRAKLIEREKVLDDLKPLIEKDVLLPDEKNKLIKTLRREMQSAAKDLDFETAALIRDKIKYLQQS